MAEIPDDGLERIHWAVSPAGGEELKARYDLWARHYDTDLTEIENYTAPMKAASAAARYIKPGARILDAACGTGLSGAALRDKGFDDLVGLDFSAGMLERAKRKGIYRELVTGDLSKPLDFPDDAFQAVIIVGESIHLPVECYREFVRIAEPGGYIVYCGSGERAQERGLWKLCGALEREGKLKFIESGEPFHPLPRSEPELTFVTVVHAVPG
ncbi:class I SAM-dependent methyltransferase [Rhizobiales bacterium]|uniref:class I SAM-dependent DNA methyltransferase n=1 Tax=Hongsoonwoonella zoysiae TaxID=2821844 RepID=UPI00155FC8D3|nr:class I SAM-dependent methyltransferase [Hongsoonwoonella zoysiae]NRG18493.1 class I SAM-dependent methyltransferase [Hongsoonwoonella zoysiae]